MSDYTFTLKRLSAPSHSAQPFAEKPSLTQLFEILATASLFVLPYLMLFAVKAL